MLLKLSEQLNLEASQEDVWKLLRDTRRLAAFLPGVESVNVIEGSGAEAYQAKASDKVGPFKVALQLEIRVAEEQPPNMLRASLRGADSIGLNRLSGSLHVSLSPAGQATLMRFEAEIEILGKLATLGAAPMRRRATEKFAQFARNIQTQFAGHARRSSTMDMP
jgi:uncharacterized protein